MKIHRVIINGVDRGTTEATLPAVEHQHMLSRIPGNRFVRIIEKVVKRSEMQPRPEKTS